MSLHSGVFRLAELNIDGLVHAPTLTNDYYQFDPGNVRR